MYLGASPPEPPITETNPRLLLTLYIRLPDGNQLRYVTLHYINEL